MSTKTAKIIYWITTGIIFLFEGVMPALTGQSELAVEGITSLGYPLYFVTVLQVAKVAGSLAIILPWTPNRIKEWAYAGLAFDFVCAFVSHWAVEGLSGEAFFPLIVLAILAVSYWMHDKIHQPFARG